MSSFSGVGIALCLVFGIILTLLVAAELFYLLWWKKTHPQNRNPFSFLNQKNPNGHQLDPEAPNPNPPKGTKSPFNEESIESELMRTHNLVGPPRFLFTINEESKEDMESDEGRSRSSRTRSLSDLIFPLNDGTPFLTPLSSPTTLRAPGSLDSLRINNPLFEEECYLDWLRSSPPPNLKFLKDAEDKFLRKILMVESDRKRQKIEELGSGKNVGFAGMVGKGPTASSAQVLPLASSPINLSNPGSR